MSPRDGISSPWWDHFWVIVLVPIVAIGGPALLIEHVFGVHGDRAVMIAFYGWVLAIVVSGLIEHRRRRQKR